MDTINDQAAGCLRLFREVNRLLNSTPAGEKFRVSLPAAGLDDEIGRFRVWCSNLGALQRGHSSLDYRLRDSPLLFSNVTKLLKETQANLDETILVLSHQRLPYEDMATESEDSDGGSSQSSGSSEDGDQFSGTELDMRYAQMIDINDNLYRLSIRIRSPTSRTRGLKAVTYQERDKDTGVDVLEQYAIFDRKYLEDALRDLRKERGSAESDSDPLLIRLSSAISRRRQQLKYWRRHRAKLSSNTPTQNDPVPEIVGAEAIVQEQVILNNNLAPQPITGTGGLSAFKSDFAPKSVAFSGTEATVHHKTLDEAFDAVSVTSIATTAKDLGGNEVDVPPPPAIAVHGRDFECPYCFAICPARYGDTQRAWR